MATIKVYRYDYFDRVLKRDRRSVDYATGDAISLLGGTIIVETERVVDEDWLEEDGTIRCADVFMEPPVPAREVPRQRAA
jgi:hypothetical protein